MGNTTSPGRQKRTPRFRLQGLVHVVDASGRSDAEGVDHGKADARLSAGWPGAGWLGLWGSAGVVGDHQH